MIVRHVYYDPPASSKQQAPSTLPLKAFSRANPASAAADATLGWVRGPVTVTSLLSTHRRIRTTPWQAAVPGKR